MVGMELMKKTLKEKQEYFYAALLWASVWVIPWGKTLSFQGNIELVFLIDMIKLGVAMALFILPGIFLYILLSPQGDINSAGFISIGITFSIFLISFLGLAGRILGLSFVTVKGIYAFIGFIEIVLLAFLERRNEFTKENFQEVFRRGVRNTPLVFAIFLAMLMMFHDQLFFVDDYTYLAYLTNWQDADVLGFRNIVHEMDVLEFPRYWLAMLPMSQALLADLSGVSGLLLLGSYLEFYLVPLAMLSLYWVARFLGASRNKAGFSVLFQIILYAWMIHEYVPTGFWFYLNMSEDKVFATFLIFPALLFFNLKYIEKNEPKKLLLVFLAGVAMVLTHPVVFVFSVFIILLIALIAFFLKNFSLGNFFKLSASYALMMLPHFFIRLYLKNYLSTNATSVKETFEFEAVVRVVNDIFYGLVPDTLLLMDIGIQNKAGHVIILIFRYLPVIIFILAFIIAFKKIKDGQLYWYVFASIFLTLFATIPYTGWILGYFVSGRMISRASWFLPLGIGIVLIWDSTNKFLKTQKIFLQKNKIFLIGILLSFIFVSPILFADISGRFSAYFEGIKYYKELSQIGNYIDENTNAPVMAIALDYRDTQFLPGVARNARVISFRERKLENPHNHSLSVEEIKARVYASDFLRELEGEIDRNEYCSIIKEYDLRFVLAEDENLNLFLSAVEECEKGLDIVYKTEHFLLLDSHLSD